MDWLKCGYSMFIIHYQQIFRIIVGNNIVTILLYYSILWLKNQQEMG